MKTKTDNPNKGDQSYLERISMLSFENTPWTRESVLEMRDLLSPWSHNLKLPYGIFTTDCDAYYPAHKEIMQIISHRLRGNFRNKRILDIGCLEGYFSAECALHGATVFGIDAKILNVKKCEFIKSVLDIQNMTFVQDDAMRVTKNRYGSFDAVLALGILYHLDDPYKFLRNMRELCTGFVLIDTLVSFTDQPESIMGNWKPDVSSLRKFRLGNNTYLGRLFREYDRGTPQLSKDLSPEASLRNEFSVWLTEDSLISLLRDVGFEEISKIVFPKEEGAWWSDIRRDGRVLISAVKKREPFKSKVFDRWTSPKPRTSAPAKER